ncbi:MAG: MBL fold metallo-hydrolase [Candidatus Caldatribacterium sp.]|nr:MBL fold metallo-hydrolase [Candidatus Caldatribacterium sp.]
MEITFFGAAREVTGSSYLLRGKDARFLVDCGMFQGGREERNAPPFPFPPRDIDFILLTHAHLDHSGRIPLLVKEGFRGKIFATLPTVELCRILWLDTVKLMREEVERENRRRRRSGKPEIAPLFGEEEVEEALSLFEPVGYDEVEEEKGVQFVFRDAAHILGAAALEVWGEGTKIVFSGDIGQFGNVMEGSPPVVENADFVVVESTYGNRRHKTLEETRKEFTAVIRDAMGSCGKILIPTFVVDRAQRVLYELHLLRENLGLDCPVYFDSPLGKETTDIYLKYRHLLSGEISEFHLRDENPFAFPKLAYVTTPEESKALNDLDHAIILAGSGMCTGGRILHHLRHNLFKETTTVIFVGFQARGTLGRALVDGAKMVRIFGEEIAVRAKIATINGFSAHGDEEDLLRWIGYFQGKPTFLVTHGEEEVAETFAGLLREKGYEAFVPAFGDTFDLPRKTVVSSARPLLRENLLGKIEEELRKLREKEATLSGESEALLQSALILLREAGRLASADELPQDGV